MSWLGRRQEVKEVAEETERRLLASEGAAARCRREVGTLRAVLSQVDTAILAVDREHHRLYANPAAERLWALGPDASARVTALARLPELLAGLDEVGTQGGAWRRRLTLPDERTLEVNISALDAEAGSVILARDVSENVRLEMVRRDFIAALSHELRTPLTSIQGYAEMLRRSPEPNAATRAEFLDIVIENTGRLSRLAQDLVLLSSLETGAYPFRFEPLDATTLVPPALAVMAPLAQDFKCQLLALDFDPGVVWGDRDALHRVLLNLIENAIVHGSAADRTVPLQIELSGSRENEHYVWRVSDNGPGIGSADQPRVFERFYQVGSAHTSGPTRRQRGAGLGLAVVKHVVREHGGEVAVESRLGEGSTFLIRLPLSQNGNNL